MEWLKRQKISLKELQNFNQKLFLCLQQKQENTPTAF